MRGRSHAGVWGTNTANCQDSKCNGLKMRMLMRLKGPWGWSIDSSRKNGSKGGKRGRQQLPFTFKHNWKTSESFRQAIWHHLIYALEKLLPLPCARWPAGGKKRGRRQSRWDMMGPWTIVIAIGMVTQSAWGMYFRSSTNGTYSQIGCRFCKKQKKINNDSKVSSPDYCDVITATGELGSDGTDVAWGERGNQEFSAGTVDGKVPVCYLSEDVK